MLNGIKAIETGIDKQKLRLVHVYKEDENKVIEIITKNLDWSARTIADLYKRGGILNCFSKQSNKIYKSNPLLERQKMQLNHKFILL
jgi:alpha-L-arabinofuranosidase